MAIEIREYIGSSMNITESAVKRPINLGESFNEIGPISKDSIIQIIEGIHVGPTRNFTWYTEEALKTSIPSWTKPYLRPLIMHHNEKDGKIIGRILNVDYKTQNTRSKTPALEFTCNVPDKQGIEEIKDGRLNTVSIGVIAHDVRCSICGEQVEIVDEYGNTACGHSKGNVYDNEVCYWKIYKMEAKELSYVIVPSDIYAHNVKTIDASQYNKQYIKESNTEGVAINMSEQVKDVKEGQVKATVIDEEVKNQSAVAGTEESETKEEQKAESEVKPEVKTEEPKEDPKDKEIADLKKELEEKSKEIEKLVTEKDAVANDLIKVKADLEASVAKVEEVSNSLTAKENELASEVALKEAVENELASIKLEVREAKESEFNTLRQALNKEVIVKESLAKRSDDSLRDAIVDLKEELSTGVTALKTIYESASPLINPEKNENNPKVNVKENKTVGNINVEEGLADIFSNMFNPIRNY